MEDTGYDSELSFIPHRAEGYSNNGQRKALFNTMSIPFAAGGLYSTVEDLYTWNRALYGGQVISDESWNLMWENEVGGDRYYSYGLLRYVIPQYDNETVFWHEGAINGFTAALHHTVTFDLDLVVLCNIDGCEIDPLTLQLADLILADE